MNFKPNFNKGWQPKNGNRNRGGRAIRLKPGEMNKTEAQYNAVLKNQLFAGSIQWFGFQTMTFRLADDCRYTPDFIVVDADGFFEAHEVKGRTKNKSTGDYTYWAEADAKIKVKLAAANIPFRFCIVFPLPGGDWKRVDFSREEMEQAE